MEVRDKKASLAILEWAHDQVGVISSDALDNDTKQTCKACIAILIEVIKCDLVNIEDVLMRYGAITSKKEPLIKDEKIRKAVRAWSSMNKIEKADIQKTIQAVRGFEDCWYQITGQDENGCLWKIEINASYSETVSKDYKGGTVSITELCGEEEE